MFIHLKYIALGLFLWASFFSINMSFANHPNIVYILADDQGYGEARSFNPDLPIATPGIDRIAREGIRFTDAHSGAANCTPTRYGLLTGRYSWRTRLQAGVLTSGMDPLIADGMPTVPSLLKEHGYRTAIVGKWHLGFHYEMPAGKPMDDKMTAARTVPMGSRVIEGPVTRGFDEFFGYHHGREIRTWIENDRVVDHLESFDEMLPRIRETSVDYLKERGQKKDGPFFLYIALSSPHTPIAPVRQWQGKSGLGTYADFVMQTDDVVRQVLDGLDDAGLAENTLVFFTTDNGTSRAAPVPELRDQGYDPTYGFRGRKSDAWEGGHRVPFVVRWPGVIKPGSTSDDTIVHNSLLATVADILKVKVPDDAGVDSFSILPLLQGRVDGEPTHPYVIHHSTKGCFAIRQGRWKLVACKGSGGYSKGDDGQPAQLYDLEADPYEKVNRIETDSQQAGYLADLLELAVANGGSKPGSSLANNVPVDIWKTKSGRPGILKMSNTDQGIPATMAQAPTDRQPNIVVILADDLGYGDISAYDGWIKTPNLDRMAHEGLRFTDFYASGSVCSPTRAGLLTGRYQQRAGIPGVIQASPEGNRHHGLQSREVTFAERLREAGYATAIFGKWHLGYETKYNPVRHGFDQFRGFVSGNVDYFAHVDGVGFYDWWDNDRLINEHGYVTHLITQHAVDFIEQHADQPFLLYLPHEAPHAPFQGPKDEPYRIIGKRMGYGQFGHDSVRKRSAYREMVEELDAGVGAVLDALDRLGLTENTLVFFFSDNGGLGNVGSNGPLRGHKAQLWEGGIRVPALAYWPGRIATGSTDQPAISIDLMPTMLALAGTSMPDNHRLDGIDLSPVLFEQQRLGPRTLFWQFNHRAAVRQGSWKLVRDTSEQPETTLYDLASDLGEKRNLADRYPERVQAMLAAFDSWQEDVTSAVTAQPDR